jgi:hypothetical protein
MELKMPWLMDGFHKVTGGKYQQQTSEQAE